MNIFLTKKTVHPYYSAAHAALFLPLIYDVMRLPPGSTLPIRAKNLTPNSLRIRLSYGSKFIVDSDTPPFCHYADLAAEIRVRCPEQTPGILCLAPTQKFDSVAANFQPTELFSFFRLTDDWLAAKKSSLSLTRRWEPELPVHFSQAIEAFAASRPGIRSVSTSAAITVFCK